MNYWQSRRELREVRHQIRSEVEALGRRLTFINLAAGPAQIFLLALIVLGGALTEVVVAPRADA